MKVRQTMLFGFGIVCIVFVGIVVLGESSNASSVPPGPEHIAHQVSMSEGGVPAIPARSDGKLLTTEDVVRYVTTHKASIGPTVSGGPAQVEEDRLVTSKVAEDTLKVEDTGLADDAMVNVVLLHGPFRTVNVLIPPGSSLPATTNEIFEVFDAKTGNMLEWGIYAS